MVIADPYLLKPCDNPLCTRLTSRSAGYCCATCARGHEDGWELGTSGVDHPMLCHSSGCDERAAERVR